MTFKNTFLFTVVDNFNQRLVFKIFNLFIKYRVLSVTFSLQFSIITLNRQMYFNRKASTSGLLDLLDHNS